MKTILIIDDEKLFCESQARFFKKVGFNVLTAGDGNKGIALIKENQVDLVITDMLMPGKEGLEIILEVKKLVPGIAIIAVSGGGLASPRDYLNTAKKLGAKYVFEKPFDRDKILFAVNKALKDIET